MSIAALPAGGCAKGEEAPHHRDRSADRDRECRDPARPHAYFYPAKNRTEYGPDDPKADGCELLVPDHLFCCSDAKRPGER